ncbi:hypothetical protein ACOME3_008528 [Neoechinorhynchus agilis]
MFLQSETKKFEKILEKCTSSSSTEIDWSSAIELCDMVKDGKVSPKSALQMIKRTLSSNNRITSDLALECLESLVKNCAPLMQKEICAPEFVCFLRDYILSLPSEARQKPLELIHNWTVAFGESKDGKPILALFEALKIYGYKFSSGDVNQHVSAFYETDLPPEWKDGDSCFLCRDAFTFTNRKHHCRNCGDIFCQKCSSQKLPLPKFGFNEEVRVCDACHVEITNPEFFKKQNDDSLSLKRDNVSHAELNEEEQLQLALALSKSEEDERLKRRPSSSQILVSTAPSSSSLSKPSAYPSLDDRFQEIEKAIDDVSVTSAPSTVSSCLPSAPPISTMPSIEEPKPNPPPSSRDEMIMETVNKVLDYVEKFNIRLESNRRRGRLLINDTSVQSLFVILSQLTPKLLSIMKYLEDCRTYYESLQDKLASVKDASEAIDALRNEHQERIRLEARERENQRLIALNQKLEVMRMKKQECLRLQKEVQLRQFALQEQELHGRMQQQTYQPQTGYPVYHHQEMPEQPLNALQPSVKIENSLSQPPQKQEHSTENIKTIRDEPLISFDD